MIVPESCITYSPHSIYQSANQTTSLRSCCVDINYPSTNCSYRPRRSLRYVGIRRSQADLIEEIDHLTTPTYKVTRIQRTTLHSSRDQCVDKRVLARPVINGSDESEIRFPRRRQLVANLVRPQFAPQSDRKSTRLHSSH